jgi:hypothetical protein
VNKAFPIAAIIDTTTAVIRPPDESPVVSLHPGEQPYTQGSSAGMASIAARPGISTARRGQPIRRQPGNHPRLRHRAGRVHRRDLLPGLDFRSCCTSRNRIATFRTRARARTAREICDR